MRSLTFVLLLVLLILPRPAWADDLVRNERLDIQWLDDGRAAYRLELDGGGWRYETADPATERLAPLFNHERLAKDLSRSTGTPVTADRLPVQRFASVDGTVHLLITGSDRAWRVAPNTGRATPGPDLHDVGFGLRPLKRSRPSRGSSTNTEIRFVNRTEGDIRLEWIDTDGDRNPYGTVKAGEARAQHTFAGHVWRVSDDADGTLAFFVGESQPNVAIVPVGDAPPRPRGGANAPPSPRNQHISPDGRLRIRFDAHNVYVETTRDGVRVPATSDGTADDAYVGPVHWSPDSTRFVAMRRTAGQQRRVHYVEAAPRDQLQPHLHHYDYLKPGDRIPQTWPVLFDVTNPAAPRPIVIDDALFSNPWRIDRVHWRPDGSAFSFLYNQRGHEVMRVVSVDARTGVARAIVNEECDTFFDYSQKTFLEHLDGTDELLWMSERDGWNHLYLINAASGDVVRCVTPGPWVVRAVESVDADARTVTMRVMGIHRDQDPYHVHFARADLDTGRVTVLTDGDGTHEVTWSPDGQHLVARWSRADHPPVTELRRASDGALVRTLAEADWSGLLASGWRPPERFNAPGRDGATTIWGLIHRPRGAMADERRYPVVEQIYAGPHGAHVPKAFSRRSGARPVADLGFVVVQIDGMGTNWRSKAFHDVCWQNIGDAGFPDRIAWIRAAAAAHPDLDLSRGVGIYGGSAGGQNAMRALIAHHDFYTVAVADCGCHDNRMDKIWWNEAWMGWPVGPHYEASSNVVHAGKVKGHLLLIVGEKDRNVDPASTMQVVDALIRADKDFEMLVIPGAGHGAMGTPYGRRRLHEFLVRHLRPADPR